MTLLIIVESYYCINLDFEKKTRFSSYSLNCMCNITLDL